MNTPWLSAFAEFSCSRRFAQLHLLCQLWPWLNYLDLATGIHNPMHSTWDCLERESRNGDWCQWSRCMMPIQKDLPHLPITFQVPQSLPCWGTWLPEGIACISPAMNLSSQGNLKEMLFWRSNSPRSSSFSGRESSDALLSSKFPLPLSQPRCLEHYKNSFLLKTFDFSIDFKGFFMF